MRRRPRNNSRTKLGAAHSCSRAASATSRASSAETLRSGAAAVVAMPQIKQIHPAFDRRSAMRTVSACVTARLLPLALAPQAPPQILIRAGRLIDPRADAPPAPAPGPIQRARATAGGPAARLPAQAKAATP